MRRRDFPTLATGGAMGVAAGRHVVGNMGRGDIVDLHDGIGRGTFDPGGPLADGLMKRRLTEIDARPRILRHLRARGIRPVTIGELMATRVANEASA